MKYLVHKGLLSVSTCSLSVPSPDKFIVLIASQLLNGLNYKNQVSKEVMHRSKHKEARSIEDQQTMMHITKLIAELPLFQSTSTLSNDM